jgi:cytidine deaminase
MMENTLIDKLIDNARRAALNAYSVYSKFPVGAAFANKSGVIFTGCNVENISFGLTNCAERTAVFKSISEGNREIETLVVYTPTQKPTPPCGACRQVIAEFNKNARIICVCDSNQRIDTTLDKLFPVPDFPVNLRK